jgi:hypothetical protein
VNRFDFSASPAVPDALKFSARLKRGRMRKAPVFMFLEWIYDPAV